MSSENTRNRNKMGRLVPERDTQIDRLIKETESQLDNTRVFLDRIHAGEQLTRRHISEYKKALERDLERLQRERERREREPRQD